MKKFNILYTDNGQKKIFKVVANDPHSAYTTFRSRYGYSVDFLGMKRVKSNRISKQLIKVSLCVLTVCFIICLFVSALSQLIDADFIPVSSKEYVIQSGDTLWEIAKLSDAWGDVDIRFIIEDIKELSNCSAMIYPGDVIYIPMYNK